MKKIHFMLRERLFDSDLRVAELSRRTGIRRSTLDLIYKNKVQVVDLYVLARLCEFFECDLRDLMILKEIYDGG
jgi:putative transcriptional regulator